MGIRRAIGRGRAWGNALGGWRLQGRNSRGQFMRKGVRGTLGREMYRNQLRGKSTKRNTARATLTALHNNGFYVAPEAGLGGVGIDAGYGKMIAPKFRASISISAKIRYTGESPTDVIKGKVADRAFKTGSNAHSMTKYGVARGPIEGTSVTLNNGQFRMKYGAAANTSLSRNPTYRPKVSQAKTASRAAKLSSAEAKRKTQKKAKQARAKKTSTNGHITVTQQNRWANKDGSYRSGKLSAAEQRRRGKARAAAQRRKQARLR